MQTLQPVEFLGTNLLEQFEFVKADEVGADQGDGLVASPLVVTTFFL